MASSLRTLTDPDQVACDQVRAENVTDDDDDFAEVEGGEEDEASRDGEEDEVVQAWTVESMTDAIDALGFSAGSAILVLQHFDVVLPVHHAVAEAGFDAMYDRLAEGGESRFADAASDRIAGALQQTNTLRGNAVETVAMLLEVERDALLRQTAAPAADEQSFEAAALAAGDAVPGPTELRARQLFSQLCAIPSLESEVFSGRPGGW